MAIVNRYINLGMPPELAKEVAAPTGDFAVTGAISATTTVTAPTGLVVGIATGLVAAGTNLATALQLTAVVSNVITAAASTGVKLWNPTIGATLWVQNSGANDMKVYPANSSGIINAGSAGAGVTLATATHQLAFFIYISADHWISGLVNAAT